MSAVSWEIVAGFAVLVVAVAGVLYLLRHKRKPAPVKSIFSATTPAEQNALAKAAGYGRVTFVDAAQLAELESGMKHAVVLYYSAKCGPCQRALPAYLDASNFNWASEDVRKVPELYAIESRHIAKPNPLVRAYPTAVRYGNGKPKILVGAQTAEKYAYLKHDLIAQ